MAKIYGEFQPVPPVPGPVADRILGCRGSKERVEMQFLGGGAVRQLNMEISQAMYLLNILRAIQLDQGIEMPDDPRPN